MFVWLRRVRKGGVLHTISNGCDIDIGITLQLLDEMYSHTGLGSMSSTLWGNILQEGWVAGGEDSMSQSESIIIYVPEMIPQLHLVD